MSTQPPLTDAEQAAAKALARHFNLNYSDGIEHHTDVNWGPEARAVVAAVREPLYREAGERMLQHATEAENYDATEDAVYVFVVAADRLREWAALSRPASKETR